MSKAGPKQFSPAWWQNKDMSVAWTERFCAPFYQEDPALLADPKTHESIGVVFSNQRNGEIVPVGITALKDGNFIFQYHPSYLETTHYPSIAVTLPKQQERFEAQGKMLPFFDNLPAEGWFGKAQGAALGDESCLREGRIDEVSTYTDNETLESRYHRFMMFGRDYPGAVWVTYQRIDPQLAEQRYQLTIEAALKSRSSISGVQPKLLAVEQNGELHPAGYWETSTHIAKLPPTQGSQMPHLMEYEYMSIVATRALRPQDRVVEAGLRNLQLEDGSDQPVLAIKRFDRTPDGHKRHFEEINQMLGRQNEERYQGSYSDIAAVIADKVGHEGVKQFYGRLLCQFLLGNTDNHMKNFAMLHERRGDRWELAPDYDLAPTANYRKNMIALNVVPYTHGGIAYESGKLFSELQPKHLVKMGLSFGLDYDEMSAIAQDLLGNIDAAKQAVLDDPSPRLDAKVSSTSKHGNSTAQTSIREDFCTRIDGRKQQLFGTFEKFIQIQKSKGEGRGGGRG